MNVLYIEDDLLDADLTRRELARSATDIHLTCVGTLREAQERLTGANGQSYDLILLDRRLPDGDGLSLLMQIRERHIAVAVVVITGAGDEEFVVSALKAGADDYVVKRGDYLTRLPATLRAALENHRRQAMRLQRSLRVLYAEHNAVDVDLTRRHLARHAPHIHLEVVHTAHDVLQHLPPNRPAGEADVLLADFRLPGMDGLELLKEIRQTRRLDLPVVLVTGHGDEETALQALKLGATDYLPKHANYLYRLPVALENAFHQVALEREQAALRESEALFRTLATTTAGAIFMYQDERFYLCQPGYREAHRLHA
ncbi:MAG: response regulator [Anaerolineae bacterium]